MSFDFAHLNPGLPKGANLLLDAVLALVVIISMISDGRHGKIYNKVTFPAMAAGLTLNAVFGGWAGLRWALVGWGVGMAIQWVPFMLGFAKAGDVKLLAAVGALKGWPVCLFGFLYGAVAFALLSLPSLARRGELHPALQNIKGYFTLAAITQTAPDTPAPSATRRYVPWGVGLGAGFLLATCLDILIGRPFWF